MISLFERFVTTRMRSVSIGAVWGLVLALSTNPAGASAEKIVPETKLRVGVVQWIPTKGLYEEWTALGGEFVVTQEGTVELPVVGSVPIGDLDCAGLASEIASRLQSKLGLVVKPETTVGILEYPPIYVVGDVTTPGEYRFRTGLTALQALALGGGIFRSPAEERSSDKQIELSGELQGIAAETVRTEIKIARLEAEMSEATDFSLPTGLRGADDRVSAEIFGQERIIFLARAEELDRQTKSLVGLRDLFNAEIKVLQEKITAADADIQSAEKELAGVSELVDKGIALASRKTEVVRALAGYRTDRLDQLTAVMRARQGVAEATRSMEGLRDKHRTEVAKDLQEERGKLDQFVLREEITRKLLFDVLGTAAGAADEASPRTVTFTIVRREGNEPQEISAVESTPLQPGDVVKVALSPVQQSAATTSAFGSTSNIGPTAVGR